MSELGTIAARVDRLTASFDDAFPDRGEIESSFSAARSLFHETVLPLMHHLHRLNETLDVAIASKPDAEQQPPPSQPNIRNGYAFSLEKYLPALVPFTKAEFFPDNLLMLLADDGLANKMWPSPLESLDKASEGLERLLKNIPQRLSDQWVRETEELIDGIRNSLNEGLVALSSGLEQSMKEEVLNEMGAECGQALELLDAVKALLDNGIDEVIEHLDGVLDILEDVGQVIEQMQPLLDLYSEMP